MTTARELYDAYTALCVAANETPYSFKSFNNKQSIIDATNALSAPVVTPDVSVVTNADVMIADAPVIVEDRPSRKRAAIEFSGERAHVTTSLTKVERALLRRWLNRHPHAITHAKGKPWSSTDLPVEVLKFIGR